ncbi:hypothetical protein [Duganella callida]|uniref:RiboL-PSP-HEPN domain-containing protein n=1 Tax=Duganella callida TaxID=2561932 RepID=A0A4Y9S7Q7_9BURK|nr:hypothetical protein [Duganella callida]TFW17554.1 hypothetical protein E4L98_20330 [Duganella callida]
MKQEISDRFDLNIARVKNLVAIYNTYLSGPGAGRRGHQKTDVLRAATVFLHASLEDVLRSLAYWKLPTAAAGELDKIPFAGGTAMKISLGSLSAHSGKTVSAVIKESVDASLERSNYNNSTEVCGLLISIGLDTVPVQPYLSTLELAMARRHQIVHRADANPAGGKGNHSVASISTATLGAWIWNTEQFVQAVLNQV